MVIVGAGGAPDARSDSRSIVGYPVLAGRWAGSLGGGFVTVRLPWTRRRFDTLSASEQRQSISALRSFLATEMYADLDEACQHLVAKPQEVWDRAIYLSNIGGQQAALDRAIEEGTRPRFRKLPKSTLPSESGFDLNGDLAGIEVAGCRQQKELR